MIKRTDQFFKYPANLNVLDLATLVTMYRQRGEPRKAPAGDYLACSLTFRLLKEAKWWFGLYYGQQAWDALLTKNSEGYPLTEVELNILGMAGTLEGHESHREFIEKNCGCLSQLSYMVVNDLKQFGFIHENERGNLRLTDSGEKALDGIARRIYEKKFVPDMLHFNQVNMIEPTMAEARKKDNPQINLF